MNTDAKSVAESVFRQESGRIIATLIRISGSFDRAEEATERRPGTPSDFAPCTLCPPPSFDLGPPPRPGAYGLEGHVSWKWALLLPQLHGAVLQKVCGTMITYDLQL